MRLQCGDGAAHRGLRAAQFASDHAEPARLDHAREQLHPGEKIHAPSSIRPTHGDDPDTSRSAVWAHRYRPTADKKRSYRGFERDREKSTKMRGCFASSVVA